MSVDREDSKTSGSFINRYYLRNANRKTEHNDRGVGKGAGLQKLHKVLCFDSRGRFAVHFIDPQ